MTKDISIKIEKTDQYIPDWAVIEKIKVETPITENTSINNYQTIKKANDYKPMSEHYF